MNQIEFKYTQPGKPTQNAFIERFNRSFRNGVLDCYLFETLNDVRIQTDKSVKDYNEERPHDSLGGVSPLRQAQYNASLQSPKNTKEHLCRLASPS
jgi:putative transposase